MDYKIDKDIPIPDAESVYPFSSMEVGDSFFAPNRTVRQLQNAASHWRKKKGMKFQARKQLENGVEGSRIWRTE